MDLETVRKINGMAGRHRPFDWFMTGVAQYGHWVFVLYGIWMWFGQGSASQISRRRQSASRALAGVILCSTLSWMIGLVWKRKRPFVRDWRIWNFTGHRANASFPSNHTANGMVVAWQLWHDHMPGAWLMALWSGMLAFSRVFAGIHFPSDILGGAVLAGAVHGAVNHFPWLRRIIDISASAVSTLMSSAGRRRF
jgi:undecaprenyl-diphosphatase